MTRSEAARKAGLARAKQFTPASQRAARRHLTSEQAAANGRRGAQATIALYGELFFFEKWRNWKLDHPSRLEVLMIDILSRLKINYEREHRLADSLLTLDFFIPDLNCAIEINGSIHDPGKPGYAQRLRNEQRKAALCGELGIPVLRLHHTDFQQLAQVIERVQQFIAQPGRNVI
jgi:very-short-patch-repair endonuclease